MWRWLWQHRRKKRLLVGDFARGCLSLGGLTSEPVVSFLSVHLPSRSEAAAAGIRVLWAQGPSLVMSSLGLKPNTRESRDLGRVTSTF